MLEDTEVSTKQYGVLSASFLIVYAAAHMPCVICIQGRFADKIEKARWVVFASSSMISVGTLVVAFAVDFEMLLVSRIAAAVASAVCDTLFLRLIGLHFPTEKRGFVAGIFLLACYIGPGLAILTIVASQYITWRQLYFSIGSVSLITSCLAAVFWVEHKFTEADRATQAKCHQIKVFEELTRILKENLSITLTVIAFAYQYIAGFTISYYEAIYMTQQFPDQVTLYSVISFSAICSVPIALISAGKFTDWKEKCDPKWRPLTCW